MLKSRINVSLRPLSARALKSTLDTLRPYLAESTVLDLFAGQGRFGLGALEEGASEVVFVENHFQTAQALKKEGKGQVSVMDVWKYLEGATQKFDIVFADPPFELWKNDFEIKLLTHAVKALKPGSILLVKHPKGVVLSGAIQELRFWKTSVFGESGLTYFRYGEEV